MKRLISITLVFFLFLGSCSQKQFLFGIAKKLSLQSLENLLGTKINLAKDSIFIEQAVPTAKACKILSSELCTKITANGSLRFENELVSTNLFWEKKDSVLTKIIFLRKKKNVRRD